MTTKIDIEGRGSVELRDKLKFGKRRELIDAMLVLSSATGTTPGETPDQESLGADEMGAFLRFQALAIVSYLRSWDLTDEESGEALEVPDTVAKIDDVDEDIIDAISAHVVPKAMSALTNMNKAFNFSKENVDDPKARTGSSSSSSENGSETHATAVSDTAPTKTEGSIPESPSLTVATSTVDSSQL